MDFLASEFLMENDTSVGVLSCRKLMEIFLRFVNDPSFQTGMAQDFGVLHFTVNKTSMWHGSDSQ